MKLPPVDVKYAETLVEPVCLAATRLPSPAILRDLPLLQARMHALRNETALRRVKGLTPEQIRTVDLTRFTVFLPRRYRTYPAGLYLAVWHELGHVAAYALGVDHRHLNEAIAIAHGFRGLMLAVQEGKVKLDAAVALMETAINGYRANPFRMFSPHLEAVNALRVGNPTLAFRHPSPEEIIAALDRSLDHLLDVRGQRRVFLLTGALFMSALAVLITSVLLF